MKKLAFIFQYLTYYSLLFVKCNDRPKVNVFLVNICFSQFNILINFLSLSWNFFYLSLFVHILQMLMIMMVLYFPFELLTSGFMLCVCLIFIAFIANNIF